MRSLSSASDRAFSPAPSFAVISSWAAGSVVSASFLRMLSRSARLATTKPIMRCSFWLSSLPETVFLTYSDFPPRVRIFIGSSALPSESLSVDSSSFESGTQMFDSKNIMRYLRLVANLYAFCIASSFDEKFVSSVLSFSSSDAFFAASASFATAFLRMSIARESLCMMLRLRWKFAFCSGVESSQTSMYVVSPAFTMSPIFSSAHANAAPSIAAEIASFFIISFYPPKRIFCR